MKYSELINQIKASNQPDKERIKNNIYRLYEKKKTNVLAILCVVAICIGLIFGSFVYSFKVLPLGKETDIPVHLADISPISSVKPTLSKKNNIISTDTSFEVTTKTTLSTKEFKEIFNISPSAEFTVTKNLGNTFTVNFLNPLKSDTLYKIRSLCDSKTVYSWAFQTETPLEITDTYPKNNGTIKPFETVYIDFSHSNVENLAENFTIYPAVAGTFEKHGKRWTFIPSTDFEEGVLYTITISDKICGYSNQTLEKEFSFSFMAKSEGITSNISIYHPTEDLIETFQTDSIPIIALESERTTNSQATVDIFKISSAEKFIELHKFHVGVSEISNCLSDSLPENEKLKTFTAEIENSKDYDYIVYPEALENGLYISKISIGKTTLYQFLQVNDLAVYTINSDNNYTVWVNNSITGLPQSKALVTISDSEAVFTDNNGLTNVNSTNHSDIYEYMIVRAGDSSEYVSRLNCSPYEKAEDFTSKYRLSLQTDSSVYMPSDTVKVFGFIDTIVSNEKIPEVLDLKASWNDSVSEIPVNADGYFSFEFLIPADLSSINQSITAYYKNDTILSADFIVTDFEHPVYKFDITTDKASYTNGEIINYVVHATSKDGSPAQNLTIYTDNGGYIVTNNNGVANYSKSVNCTDFEYLVTTFAVYTASQNPPTVYKVDTKVFPCDIYLETEKLKDYISVSIFDSMTQKPRNSEVNVELHRISYSNDDQIDIFNPFTQNDEHFFSYSEQDDIVSSQSVLTTNGKLDFKISEDALKYTNAYYKFSTTSPNGITVTSVCYVNDTFKPQTEYPYTLSTDKTVYDVGENVNLSAHKNTIKLANGTLALTLVSNGNKSTQIYTDLSNISFKTSENMVGDLHIYGALFDGKDIHILEKQKIEIANSKINLKITTDKENYLPGEVVLATIETKSPDNTPISALVNINVIDKFIGNTVSYSFIDYKNLVFDSTSKCSVNPFVAEVIEEEKQSGHVFPYYNKAILYENITTDKNGKATISFVLPEYSGNWTICATSEFSTVKKSIQSKDDFYIEANVDNVLTPSDSCMVSFRFITGYNSSKDCSYNIALYKDNKLISTQTLTDKVNCLISHDLGTLDLGEYKLRISGKSDNLSDAAEYSFTVSEENIVCENTEKTYLEESFDLDAAKYNSDLKVALYDESQELYFSIAEKLKNSENKIAAALADSFINASELGKDQIKLITQSSFDNLKSEADFCTIFNDYLSKSSSKALFKDALKQNSDILTELYCYMALAALDEPVLINLYEYAAIIEDLTLEERIYLATAFAYAGDYKTAHRIYNEHISTKIITANGISQFDYDGTLAEKNYLTAITIRLCGKLSAENGKSLVKGFILNESNIEKYSFELLSFIKNYINGDSAENKISIIYQSGKKEKIKFSKYETYRFIIPKEKLETVTFESSSGATVISASGNLNLL